VVSPGLGPFLGPRPFYIQKNNEVSKWQRNL
jgi:hypothetical protein